MDIVEVRAAVHATFVELFGPEALKPSQRHLERYVEQWEEAERVTRPTIDTRSWSLYRDDAAKDRKAASARRANGVPDRPATARRRRAR